MSTAQAQKPQVLSGSLYRKLAGWLFLALSIPMLLWVLAAGVIAVPHPSFLSLYGGPAVSCFLLGLGLLKNRARLLWGALAALLLGGFGWVVLP